MTTTERIEVLRGKLQGWLDEANAAPEYPEYEGEGGEHPCANMRCDAIAFYDRARTITPAALKGYLALLADVESDIAGWLRDYTEPPDLMLRPLTRIEAAVREMEAA